MSKILSVIIRYEGEEIEASDLRTRWEPEQIVIYGSTFEIRGDLEDIAYLGEAMLEAVDDIAKERREQVLTEKFLAMRNNRPDDD